MKTDFIHPDSLNNLHELFHERVNKSPDVTAYQYYKCDESSWKSITWSTCAQRIQRWASALNSLNLNSGDRVAILVRNSLDWVFFEQASFACNLVVVPLYTDDRAENIAYILADADVKCILIDGAQHWKRLFKVRDRLTSLSCIITTTQPPADLSDERLILLDDWLLQATDKTPEPNQERNDLASIVYTSGTTGKPKGVMLSHDNIMQNAWSGVNSIAIFPDDHFLSFLPMSHMLERTVGYYIPIISGASVSFSRSIAELAEDMMTQNPSVLICVPRIFERVHIKVMEAINKKGQFLKSLFNFSIECAWNKFLYTQQRGPWKPAFMLLPLFERLFFRKIRSKFGSRYRFAISGGAPLEFHVAKFFIAIGINITQGYGLTEFSPVISVNRINNNDPKSVGEALPGVEISVSRNDELRVKGKSLMLGYWNNEEATHEVIDKEGWLHTGDKVKIVDDKIYVTGRIKDIIVLSNGEKIPPSEIEQTIMQDGLIESIVVIGERRPYLSALICPSHKPANDEDISAELLGHIHELMKEFPGYAKIHRVAICEEPWTIENGLLTPTMKPRRKFIMERYADLIEEMYDGH